MLVAQAIEQPVRLLTADAALERYSELVVQVQVQRERHPDAGHHIADPTTRR